MSISSLLTCRSRFARACLFLLSSCVIASALPAQSAEKGLITGLLTADERQAAGINRLSDSELSALNTALIRVLARLTGSSGDTQRSSAIATTEDLPFSDRFDRPVAYLGSTSDLTIYLWTGEPVAYLDDDSVFGFNGKHLGWYRAGTIYDHDGNKVLSHTNNTAGSVRGLRGLKPLKGLKELKPLKPLWGLSWSQTPARVFLLGGV